MEDKNHSGTTCIMLSEARLAYWAKLPGWRLREASALLLDLDPDSSDIQSQSSFRDLQRVLLRARSMKIIHSPIKPRRLLEWATSNEIDIPFRLRSAVFGQTEIADWRKRALRRGRQLARLQSERPQSEMYPKSKITAERFMLGMALRHYRRAGSLDFNFGKMVEDLIFDKKPVVSDGAIRDWIADARANQSDILEEVMQTEDANADSDL